MGRVHCDADVDLGAHDQPWASGIGLIIDAGVEERVFSESENNGFDDEGEEGEFAVWSLGVEGKAEAGEGRDVEFVCVEEVGDGEGAGHGFEHLGLDRRERD